jgi:hypothetical protein
MAELLRTEHSRSLHDWAIYLADLPRRGILEMLHNLRIGEPAFEKTFGLPLFEYLSAHAEYSTQLFRAMSSVGAARTAGLLEAYDLGGATRLNVQKSHVSVSRGTPRHRRSWLPGRSPPRRHAGQRARAVLH